MRGLCMCRYRAWRKSHGAGAAMGAIVAAAGTVRLQWQPILFHSTNTAGNIRNNSSLVTIWRRGVWKHLRVKMRRGQ